MVTSNALVWVPPSGLDVRLLPAGRWWDAVRVPQSLGAPVLEDLGEDTGAVIEDGYGRILYWLVRTGAADHWQLPRVQVLGQSCHVAVPPQHHTHGPGLHWRVLLAGDRCLTSPVRLHGALHRALSARTG